MNLTSIIEHASPKERYQADACIIWCLDNRFHGLLNKFIKLRGYKNCDLVNVTGGAKDLVGNEKRRKNYLFSQIERSISFHGTKKVILMIHSDCAAYEQEIKKTSTEKLFLISEIVRAKERVLGFLNMNKHSFNGHLVEVEILIADFSGLYQVTSD